MKRVGCMPCISCGKEELRQIGMRFPEEIDRVAEWEAIVKEASKQDGATFFTVRAREMNDLMSREEHHELAGIRGKLEWAKTTRGKVQYDLISVYEEPTMCHSMYGLCE